MIFFLVIVLLAVGPEKLPTFMRTVGKGMRQIRNASREFKDAIGFDELMREGDPFRAPPVRPPRARPVPVREQTSEESNDPKPQATQPPPWPPATDAVDAPEPSSKVEPRAEGETASDPDSSKEVNP